LPISGVPEQGCRTIPTTFYLLKIYLTEQLWTRNITRKSKANNY